VSSGVSSRPGRIVYSLSTLGLSTPPGMKGLEGKRACTFIPVSP
jgi:hypothetical protein